MKNYFYIVSGYFVSHKKRSSTNYDKWFFLWTRDDP